jgi:hypothetical protein
VARAGGGRRATRQRPDRRSEDHHTHGTAFGLAEFDPGFTDRISILADRQAGAPLTAEEAPFQLILTGEKRAARWVRQVASIEIRELEKR